MAKAAKPAKVEVTDKVTSAKRCHTCRFRKDELYCVVTLPPFVRKHSDPRSWLVRPNDTCDLHQFN